MTNRNITSSQTLHDHTLAPGTTETANDPNRRNGFTPTKPSKSSFNSEPGIGGVMTSRGKLADLSNAEIARLGIAANIAGVSHDNGRLTNARLVAEHIWNGGQA